MSDGPGARLLGSTHYLASRTEHVSHVVPVPVPGPPARVITPLGMTRWQLPGPAPRPPKRRKIPAAAAAVRIVADLPRQKVYVKHHPFECTEGCDHEPHGCATLCRVTLALCRLWQLEDTVVP